MRLVIVTTTPFAASDAPIGANIAEEGGQLPTATLEIVEPGRYLRSGSPATLK